MKIASQYGQGSPIVSYCSPNENSVCSTLVEQMWKFFPRWILWSSCYSSRWETKLPAGSGFSWGVLFCLYEFCSSFAVGANCVLSLHARDMLCFENWSILFAFSISVAYEFCRRAQILRIGKSKMFYSLLFLSKCIVLHFLPTCFLELTCLNRKNPKNKSLH